MANQQEAVELLSALGVTHTQGCCGVNCPRDGQILLALLSQGAELAVGFEPRAEFHRELIRNTSPMRRYVGLNFNWLFGERGPRFELFLWLEGYEQHYDPSTQLEAILSRLEPSGRIIVGLPDGEPDAAEKFLASTLRLNLNGEIVLRRCDRLFWQVRGR